MHQSIRSRSLRMRPRRDLAVLLVIAALVTTACSSSSSKTAGTSSTTAKPTGKSLTIGTSADFPPLSSKGTSGSIEGFENDMLKRLTATINRPFTWSQLDFNGLIPALQSGRIDMITSGMYDTAARAKVVDFVDYMKIPLSVMTLKSNVDAVKDATGLCGHSVAYLVGSPPEQTQIEQWSSQCTGAGKGAITAQGYQTVAAAIADINNGRTFAELEGDIVVLYVAKSQFGNKLGVAFNVEGGTSNVGLAVQKGSALLPSLQTAMTSYIQSSAYCDDAKAWDLTPGDLMRTCP